MEQESRPELAGTGEGYQRSLTGTTRMNREITISPVSMVTHQGSQTPPIASAPRKDRPWIYEALVIMQRPWEPAPARQPVRACGGCPSAPRSRRSCLRITRPSTARRAAEGHTFPGSSTVAMPEASSTCASEAPGSPARAPRTRRAQSSHSMPVTSTLNRRRSPRLGSVAMRRAFGLTHRLWSWSRMEENRMRTRGQCSIRSSRAVRERLSPPCRLC